MISNKYLTVLLFSGAMFALLLWGCGEQPSAPPEVEFGSLEVFAYYDSSFVDTVTGDPQTVQLLAPEVDVYMDDNPPPPFAHGTVPLLIEGLVPGLHNFELKWGAYNTTLQAYIEPNDTAKIEPVMTQFAQAFTSKAMYYDLDGDSIVHLDVFDLADYLPAIPGETADGEVILMFYFGAS